MAKKLDEKQESNTLPPTREEFNNLEAFVRKIDAKIERHTANFKDLLRKIYDETSNGKIGFSRVGYALAGFLMVTAVVLVLGEVIDRKGPGPDGADFTWNDTSGVGETVIAGGEGDDARILLDADQGDNDTDSWFIESEAADNDLTFVNHTTELMKLTTAGNLTITGTFTPSGATTVSNVTFNGVLTGFGGATINNTTSTSQLTITETTVQIAGAGDVTGALDVDGALTCTNVTMDAGSTAALKGVTIAESCTITPSATLTAGFDANGASTATNITMDTGSTLAAKILTVATSLDVNGATTCTNVTMDAGSTAALVGVTITESCSITPAATLTGGFDANAPSTATNLTIDSGSTLTLSGVTVTGWGAVSSGTFAGATFSGTTTLTNSIVGSAGAVISNVALHACTLGAVAPASAVVTSLDTGTGEATVDGKYAVVGGDASTALMIQKGTFTNGTATVTFAVAFGATPVVICGWNEDLSGAGVLTNTAITATSAGTTTFVPKIALPIYGYTNASYIAVGTRP